VRVTEALRHAARYGAFDHNAVARIVAGKPAKPSRGSLEAKGGPEAPSEKYLRGAGEHQRPLAGYRALSTPVAPPAPRSPEAEEDDDDGQ
jgi:hypothetical protein